MEKQHRNTSNWTKKYRHERVTKMLEVRRMIAMIEGERKMKQVRQLVMWLRCFGYSTTKLLRDVSWLGAAAMTQNKKAGYICHTPATVRSAQRLRRTGTQIRPITLVQLTRRGFKLFDYTAEGFDLDGNPISHRVTPSDTFQVKTIDRPEILRHNLLVQLITAKLVHYISANACSHELYVPRLYQAISDDHLRELVLEHKLWADAIILLQAGAYEETFAAGNPRLRGKYGFAIEVERTKKTWQEQIKLAAKIVKLNRLFHVVLATESREQLSKLLDDLEQADLGGLGRFKRSMVTQVVIRELWDAPDPF